MRLARLGQCAGLAMVTLLLAPAAFGQDAAEWLQRAANAARQLNYVGTIVYQHGGRVETSRLEALAPPQFGLSLLAVGQKPIP